MSELLGKTIGEYQVVEDLDESGDTMVFKGFQPSMNRFVALKMLKPSAARDPNAVQIFIQQGELMARMPHPNIMEVYNSGQEGGLFFRAERFAESGSLQDHLNWFYDQRLLPGLFEQIVGAIEYIHAHGYVHGNLNPRNILLDDQKRPLLTDFGTPPRQIQLPSPYLAPEQLHGGAVDSRTDVYALGVLLFEIATGQAPPPGVIANLRTHRPDMPQALEQTIYKSMAQNPDQRFHTAGEFLSAMQIALQEPAPVQSILYQQAPIPAPTPMVSQSVTVEGQNSRTNWLAIVLGILVISILCIGSFLVFRYLTAEQRTETGVQLPVQPPPGATIIVPTVVMPTREPRPTQPPEEPTLPPAEPTQPPDVPADEPPQDENPPEDKEATPEGPGGRLAERLPESCGSVGLISLGVAVVISTRSRKTTHKR